MFLVRIGVESSTSTEAELLAVTEVCHRGNFVTHAAIQHARKRRISQRGGDNLQCILHANIFARRRIQRSDAQRAACCSTATPAHETPQAQLVAIPSRPREIMHPKIDSNPVGKPAVGCLGTIDVTGTRLAPNRGQTGEYARLAMLNKCKTKPSQRGVNHQASRGVHSSTCSCPL